MIIPRTRDELARRTRLHRRSIMITMPTAASKPCRSTTCHKLQPCPDHPIKPWSRTVPKRMPGGNGWAWQRTRARILLRDGGLCTLRLEGCTSYATVIDHKINIMSGGSDHDSNLGAACKGCNERKRVLEARR